MDIETVPCAQCRRQIDARRAAIPFTEGKCELCRSATLSSTRSARAPQYETDVWSQGGRL